MATELTVIECARNSEVQAEAGVEADSGGVYIDATDVDASKVLFRCVSSDSARIYVKAGMYSAEGIGNLEVATTIADTIFVGPVETARFKDTDGYINLLGDSAVSSKGNFDVQAILLP